MNAGHLQPGLRDPSHFLVLGHRSQSYWVAGDIGAFRSILRCCTGYTAGACMSGHCQCMPITKSGPGRLRGVHMPTHGDQGS